MLTMVKIILILIRKALRRIEGKYQYDYDVPEYDIWHMMIDQDEQGRGYGSKALDLVIQYIATKPFGDSDRVALTCNKDNPAARKLYESKGFNATGNEDEDEIEMVMTVQ